MSSAWVLLKRWGKVFQSTLRVYYCLRPPGASAAIHTSQPHAFPVTQKKKEDRPHRQRFRLSLVKITLLTSYKVAHFGSHVSNASCRTYMHEPTSYLQVSVVPPRSLWFCWRKIPPFCHVFFFKCRKNRHHNVKM